MKPILEYDSQSYFKFIALQEDLSDCIGEILLPRLKIPLTDQLTWNLSSVLYTQNRDRDYLIPAPGF